MTRRLISLVVSVSMAILVLAIGLRAWERETLLKSQSEAAKSNAAVRISASCAAAVWQFDERAIDTVLRSELLDKSLVSIRIFQNNSDTIEWLTRLPDGRVVRSKSAPVGQLDTRNYPIEYHTDTESVSLTATVSVWFDDGPWLNLLYSDLVWNILVVVLIVASLTIILSWTVLRKLVAPLEHVRAGIQKAAHTSSEGLESESIVNRLPKTAFPELTRMAGDLDEIFGKIAASISRQKSTEAKIQNLNDNLEVLVAERTQEMAVTNQDLTKALDSLKKVQEELVNSAQLAVLGRLVASIAHEINTPLAAIVSSNSTISNGLAGLSHELLPFYADLSVEGRVVFHELLAMASHRSLPAEFYEARNLRKKYAQFLEHAGNDNANNTADILVESGFRGSMEDLQRISKVEGYPELIERAGQVGSMLLASHIIQVASDKVSKFVSALKLYSRADAGDDEVDVDIASSLETVLMLFQHETKLGVHVERCFGVTAAARCRPEAIQQVWTNLISNAFHAMNHQGTLTVTLKQEARWILIGIHDTGSGIPREVQPRVFSPFFTTKKPGEGTGLGLDIARRIVTDCFGTIEFESQPGSTLFQVRLPASDSLP